jgi:uncharacterized iron-regulated membrane protein
MSFEPAGRSFGRATTPPARRPLAYRLHHLFGLKLSLFMAFVCATGTLATVSHEIEWLLFPEVRASVPADAEPWGQMWEAAKARHPDGWVRGISSYDRSDSSYFARVASVALADGREVNLLLDPSTATVTGEQAGTSFHAFMRALHYTLFAPGDWSFYLVTGLGFVLLGSLVTGLLVYKRFWRGLLRRPRTGRGVRTLLGDLHRLAGLWALPFSLLIALTSIWYFAERAGVDWESSPPANASLLRSQPGAAEVDRWVATAREAMPGLKITGIFLPWSDGDPVVVQGEWQAWLVRERTNAAFLDPVTGRLLGLRAAHKLGAGERLVHTADPLHFGNFAGLAGKLLWMLFGLMLTGLAVSGALINGQRLTGSKEAGLTRSWGRSLGLALLPTLLLIGAVPAYFYATEWDMGSTATLRPAGSVASSGGEAALFRGIGQEQQRWCARPSEPTARLDLLISTGTRLETEHDAGLFCADLPAGERIIGAEARGGQESAGQPVRSSGA